MYPEPAYVRFKCEPKVLSAEVGCSIFGQVTAMLALALRAFVVLCASMRHLRLRHTLGLHIAQRIFTSWDQRELAKTV